MPPSRHDMLRCTGNGKYQFQVVFYHDIGGLVYYPCNTFEEAVTHLRLYQDGKLHSYRHDHEYCIYRMADDIALLFSKGFFPERTNGCIPRLPFMPI